MQVGKKGGEAPYNPRLYIAVRTGSLFNAKEKYIFKKIWSTGKVTSVEVIDFWWWSSSWEDCGLVEEKVYFKNYVI